MLSSNVKFNHAVFIHLPTHYTTSPFPGHESMIYVNVLVYWCSLDNSWDTFSCLSLVSFYGQWPQLKEYRKICP